MSFFRRPVNTLTSTMVSTLGLFVNFASAQENSTTPEASQDANDDNAFLAITGMLALAACVYCVSKCCEHRNSEYISDDTRSAQAYSAMRT